MGDVIQAIETRYAGRRFRSRLEARWAVFFDSLGVTWEYEPEGFLVGDDKRAYLPDFKIQTAFGEWWIEVKGDREKLDIDLLAAFATASPSQQIAILGPVPRLAEEATPLHWMVRRIADKPFLAQVYFTPGGNLWQWGFEYPFAPDLVESTIGPLLDGGPATDLRVQPNVRDAYIAASSARFEHGEEG